MQYVHVAFQGFGTSGVEISSVPTFDAEDRTADPRFHFPLPATPCSLARVGMPPDRLPDRVDHDAFWQRHGRVLQPRRRQAFRIHSLRDLHDRRQSRRAVRKAGVGCEADGRLEMLQSRATTEPRRHTFIIERAECRMRWTQAFVLPRAQDFSTEFLRPLTRSRQRQERNRRKTAFIMFSRYTPDRCTIKEIDR